MEMHAFGEQTLPQWRRAVLKVGSSLLAADHGGLSTRFAAGLADFVARCRAQGREVVIVSSGAVAAGRGVVLPVVNENDTVAVDELKLGDNDNLAAVVAALVDAELLLIATDIHGLYSGHPVCDSQAQPVPRVEAITPEIMRMAAGKAGALGTGGMRTRLEAASKAAAAGIGTALFCGRDAATVSALAHGKLHGTYIEPHGDRRLARKLWLRHAPTGMQNVRVDAGAAQALGTRGASLLPGGVVSVEGEFGRGDLIEVLLAGDAGTHVFARGLVQYNSADLRRIVGRHSREIESILGFRYGESVMHRDDLVVLPREAAE